MPATLINHTHGLRVLADQPRPLGLVPTMGALHRGHFSLLARARRECATVVASIYVNPLQFGPQEDLSRYPRSLAEDLALCNEAEVDFVFAPQQLTEGTATLVVPHPQLAQVLCGVQRPGHFIGVATVVMQLLHLIRPDRAYFGQKDAQQLTILQKVLRDLYLPIGIIPCAIIRELDGLALSSRNRYLSAAEREQAPLIYRALQAALAQFLEGERDPQVLKELVLANLGALTTDYVALVHPTTLQSVTSCADPTLLAVAARLGTTRLIDNIRLTEQIAPVIAIDGPAGSGKSTVARLVAQALDFIYLDTGAMYRAVTWAALTQGLPLTATALTELAQSLVLRLETTATGTRIWANNTEITTEIRSQLVTAQVSIVAAVAGVRQVLVAKQQRLGRRGGVVMEGRDIGTQVFPQAELKIFLTASPQVRALRRQQDLLSQKEIVPDLAQLTRQIQDRDFQDANRAIAPFIQAPDALVIDTDQRSIPEVVAQISNWAKYL